ncbi:hypothetical protein CDD80_7163 [Ophiocordyceps camponoti-rufipedis]|uniref:Uncharacterized protein n=1 Tax=Ophiocordyceps camponoti-rufipedis TaxID=2004952 RepID=A0A2C5YMQ9_9HYPO|nr:hypothetical protein CDD80_7163 [Ophiocordyceps camponoti-rufipedis]
MPPQPPSSRHARHHRQALTPSLSVLTRINSSLLTDRSPRLHRLLSFSSFFFFPLSPFLFFPVFPVFPVLQQLINCSNQPTNKTTYVPPPSLGPSPSLPVPPRRHPQLRPNLHAHHPQPCLRPGQLAPDMSSDPSSSGPDRAVRVLHQPDHS